VQWGLGFVPDPHERLQSRQLPAVQPDFLANQHSSPSSLSLALLRWMFGKQRFFPLRRTQTQRASGTLDLHFGTYSLDFSFYMNALLYALD